MSLGIPLSQLFEETFDQFKSGICTLDDYLGGGFQPRCIYEIFGTSGIGKTRFGLQVVKYNPNKKCLWIQTFKGTTYNHISYNSLDMIRITKFSQILYLFQTLKDSYDIIIIDGLSQLVSNYLYTNSKFIKDIHQFKVKNLLILMSTFTKYCRTHKTTLLMLNDSMNTSYQDFNNETFELYSDESQFLVKNSRKKMVQMLKSALVANLGIGNKDSEWEAFIKLRIGFFWGWEIPKKLSDPNKCRIIILFDMENQTLNNGKEHEFHMLRIKTDDDGWFNAIKDMKMNSEYIDPKNMSIIKKSKCEIPLTPHLVSLSNIQIRKTNEAPSEIIYDSEG